MGSTVSLHEETCCGLCTRKFDYKQALLRIKTSIEDYHRSLQKNIDQFKQKDQRVVRQNFNQIKENAFNYIKNNQQPRARKLLTDFFYKQKQPKLITREIDFLDKKQKMLNELRNQIESDPKPKKSFEQRNQIIGYDHELQRIKAIEFDKNADQISGDSGDVQSYIDRIIDELKAKIQALVIVHQIVQPRQSQVQKKPQIIRQPSPKEYRENFLRKLQKHSKYSKNRCRKLTPKQIQFFETDLGIKLNKSSSSSITHSNAYSSQKINYMNQSSINTAAGYQQINDQEITYYLNCDGYELFDMQQFVKCDWSIVEVLDLQQCGISSHWWRTLVRSKATCLPNLKVLYLGRFPQYIEGMNQIKQVTNNQLQMMKDLKYLSFGWWNESNFLDDESKRVISEYQQRNRLIKIEFPQD